MRNFLAERGASGIISITALRMLKADPAGSRHNLQALGNFERVNILNEVELHLDYGIVQISSVKRDSLLTWEMQGLSIKDVSIPALMMDGLKDTSMPKVVEHSWLSPLSKIGKITIGTDWYTGEDRLVFQMRQPYFLFHAIDGRIKRERCFPEWAQNQVHSA
jgi:hypothetical protein